MMRLHLCVEDQPDTGGQIEPYVGPSITFRGHQAAMLGAHVHCNACKSTGIIAKAGGPRRLKHHSNEIALDGDMLLCQCAKPPRMIATAQSNAWHDDMLEILGDVSAPQQRSSSDPCAGRVRPAVFNDRYVLKDRDGKPLANTAYAIKRESGDHEYGETDESGHTRLLTHAASAEIVNIYIAG